MSDRKLALSAWESLFRAQHELMTQMSEDFVDQPITQAEYDVLLTLSRYTDRTARLREVTANMLISQPSVSRLVDRMVERQLVTKHPDPEDRRGALICATEAGSRAFRSLAARHGRSIAERMSKLTAAEQQTLLSLTEKLRGR